MKEEKKHIYRLELTERQAKLLSYACDSFSRLICGQDWTYQELFEQAWEKRCKEATGNMMDKEWDGGWQNMRHEAEELSKQLKKRFWGMESNAMYGIRYDETADVLFDLHCVIRHQLWKDRPEDKKSHGTVDAFEAMQVSDEPLAVIRRTDVSSDEIMKDMNRLYSDIDTAIHGIVSARADGSDAKIANVHHKMESLMVATKQELRVIAGYLTNKDYMYDNK